MNPFVSIIVVETPKVVGSFPSEDFAAPGQPNPSGTDPYSFLQVPVFEYVAPEPVIEYVVPALVPENIDPEHLKTHLCENS